MGLEPKKCANPDCGATFHPYNSRQRVCKRKTCKLWLYQENTYRPTRYILKDHPEIEPFTREDLIKVEE